MVPRTSPTRAAGGGWGLWGHSVYVELGKAALPQKHSCPGPASPAGADSGRPGAVAARAPREGFPLLHGARRPCGSCLEGGGGGADPEQDPAVCSGQPGPSAAPAGGAGVAPALLCCGWRACGTNSDVAVRHQTEGFQVGTRTWAQKAPRNCSSCKWHGLCWEVWPCPHIVDCHRGRSAETQGVRAGETPPPPSAQDGPCARGLWPVSTACCPFSRASHALRLVSTVCPAGLYQAGTGRQPQRVQLRGRLLLLPPRSAF